MTIQRAPSLLFAGLWSAWLVAVYVALANPERPRVGLVVLLVFFAIEIPAAVVTMPGNARDTLSEISTWIIAKTSKHKRFARGWNAAVLAGLILPVGWLLMRTVTYYADSEGLGIGMGALVAIFLWDHFVSPDIHG